MLPKHRLMASRSEQRTADGAARALSCSTRFSSAQRWSLAALFVVLLVSVLSCSAVHLPWSGEEPTELNVSFRIQNNLLFPDNVTIQGAEGRFAFATADRRTAIDPQFAARIDPPTSKGYVIRIGQRRQIAFRALQIPLHQVADALLGADVFPSTAVSIDYRAQLLSFDKNGIHAEGMTISAFGDEPAVDIVIAGRRTTGIVDTASPETLVVPRSLVFAKGDRAAVDVELGGERFFGVDVRVADVREVRIGNRLLSKFLIWIDYKNHRVGLWRDPRIQ